MEIAKPDKITQNHRKIVNIYIVYEINKTCSISSYPTLENCLFEAVSLTKNNDIDEYKYSGYEIGSDIKGVFSLGNGFGRNCVTFVVDMNSVDNKKRDILILGEEPTQGLEGTTTTEKRYSINLTENNKKSCLSLHHNGADSYLLMVQKLLNLKPKTLRSLQLHYVQEIFQNNFQQII